MRFLRILITAVLISTAALGILAGIIYYTAPVNSLKNRASYTPIDSSRVRELGLKQANFVGLDNISPFLALAVVLSEDVKFYEHPGFDFPETYNALKSYLTGSPLRGASTISQQLVKNVFLSPHRTLRRKIVEAIYTLKLERNFSKDQILALYLNCAQFGEGIYGVKDATEFYFKKPPSKLSLLEATFLSLLLPAPVKRSKIILSGLSDDKLTRFATNRLEKIYAVLIENQKESNPGGMSFDDLKRHSFPEVMAKLRRGGFGRTPLDYAQHVSKQTLSLSQ